MYEIGKVYIWQNQVGIYEFLNGCETTVLEMVTRGQDVIIGGFHWAQKTDTPAFAPGARFIYAERGDLRPKNPPSGERLVRDLFVSNPVMEPV